MNSSDKILFLFEQQALFTDSKMRDDKKKREVEREMRTKVETIIIDTFSSFQLLIFAGRMAFKLQNKSKAKRPSEYKILKTAIALYSKQFHILIAITAKAKSLTDKNEI